MYAFTQAPHFQIFKYPVSQADYLARTTSKLESRGKDGRGFDGPGLDHGVFVPFRIMFGEEFLDVPIVQVSINADMGAKSNWKLGQTVAALRYVLILCRFNLCLMSSNFSERRVSSSYQVACLSTTSATLHPSRRTPLVTCTSHSIRLSWTRSPPPMCVVM